MKMYQILLQIQHMMILNSKLQYFEILILERMKYDFKGLLKNKSITSQHNSIY